MIGDEKELAENGRLWKELNLGHELARDLRALYETRKSGPGRKNWHNLFGARPVEDCGREHRVGTAAAALLSVSPQASTPRITFMGKSWARSSAPSCLTLRGGGRSSAEATGSTRTDRHREPQPLKADDTNVTGAA